MYPIFMYMVEAMTERRNGLQTLLDFFIAIWPVLETARLFMTSRHMIANELCTGQNGPVKTGHISTRNRPYLKS